MSAFLGVVYRAYNQGGPFSPLFGSKIKRVERRHGAAQRKLDVFFSEVGVMFVCLPSVLMALRGFFRGVGGSFKGLGKKLKV